MDANILRELQHPSNMHVREYRKCTFTIYNGKIQEKLENVGIRVKGGYSRQFMKKSWKMSFNTFVPKRELYQLKKLQL